MKTKKLLLVDDEKEIIFALEKFFASKGYEVSTASDGQEALDKLADGPDIVVLDIRMPNVNGVEVLKEIKNNYPATKTVVLTGYLDTYKDEIEKLGAEALLTKPFGVEKLIETIDKLSKGKPTPLEKPDDLFIVAKAKILIYPANSLTYGNIAAHLNRVYFSGGIYQMEPAYNNDEFLKKISSCKPDIVLVDSVNFGDASRLTKKIFQGKHKPKDLIIFGQAVSKGKADEKIISGLFDPISTAFNKEYMIKLAKALRQACIERGLREPCKKRWDIDYENVREEKRQKLVKKQDIAKRRSNFKNMPEAINNILSRFIKVNQWHISPSDDLAKNLKADSIAIISALGAVEDYYGINILEDDLLKIKTAGDIYRYIARAVFYKEWKEK